MSAPAAVEIKTTSVRRKQWSNESMVSAIKAVKDGMSVMRAAAQFDIPRSTLQDRVTGRVKHGQKPGPRAYLT